MELDEEGVGSGPPSMPDLVLESGLTIIAGTYTILRMIGGR